MDSTRSRNAGRRPASSLAAWRPGQPRHRDVEDRQVDIVRQRARDRLRAVGGVGHDREVGLRVQQLAQPAPHDRVVVGDEHARDERDAHRGAPAGSRKRTSVPCGRGCADGELRADEQRALAHAADAGRLGLGDAAASPIPSSRDRRTTASAWRRSEHAHARRAGVAHDVGQALLRDAVDTSSSSAVSGELAVERPLELQPVCATRRSLSAISALWRPSSSSASGRRRRAISRTSSAPRRAASRSPSRSPRSSPARGARASRSAARAR